MQHLRSLLMITPEALIILIHVTSLINNSLSFNVWFRLYLTSFMCLLMRTLREPTVIIWITRVCMILYRPLYHADLAFYIWLSLVMRPLYDKYDITTLDARYLMSRSLNVRLYGQQLIMTRLIRKGTRHLSLYVRYLMRHDKILKYENDYYESHTLDNTNWYDSKDYMWYDTYDPYERYKFEQTSIDKLATCQQVRGLLKMFSDKEHQPIAESTALGYVSTHVLLDELGLQSRHSTGVLAEGYLSQNSHRGDIPIVLDTGCSLSVSPFIEDFTSDLELMSDSKMHGLSDSTTIKGIGWVSWPIRDVFGRVAVIRTRCYHIPEARVRLCSTQTYFQEGKRGKLVQDHEKIILKTHDNDELYFPYQMNSNLPLMFLDNDVTPVGLTGQHAYDLTTDRHIETTLTLLDDNNYNLSKQQKELLLWHNRLGHMGMGWLQSLMRFETIPVRTTGVNTCEHPKCPACQFSKQQRRSPKSTLTQQKPQREMAIRRDNLNAGECFSVDQYKSSVLGRLGHTKGRESPSSRYSGGTIFRDHASGFIYIHHQTSTRMSETLEAKHALERFSEQYGIKIKSFHADNKPFGDQLWLDDLTLQNQTITYSGSYAHHQNGVAERSLKTINQWTLALMMHQMLHWPEQFDPCLWPFAMDQVVAIWNNLPRGESGLSPLELYTGVTAHNRNSLLHMRVWGCPVYVLDPSLADGKRIPKWTKRSRQGMYLGVSPVHSTTVGRVLHLVTGHISPQFHLVYDELFTTVASSSKDEQLTTVEWTTLLDMNGHEHTLDTTDVQGDIVPFTEFFDDFIDTQDDDNSTSDDAGHKPKVSTLPDVDPPPPEPPPLLPLSSSVPEGDEVVGTSESEGVTSEDVTSSTKQEVKKTRKKSTKVNPPKTGIRTRSGALRTRSGRAIRKTPQAAGTYLGQLLTVKSLTRLPHQFYRYLAHGMPHQKIKAKTLNDVFLSSLDWQPHLNSLQTQQGRRHMFQLMSTYDEINETLEGWNPMALLHKANDADTPNWHQAMNGPNADGFWQACEKEINTLIDMDVWEVVERKPWMKVIPSTWAFKVKRFPDGLVRSLKSRFCCRGDRQEKDIDYFDTYAPVVKWTTVRLILVLVAQLGLASKQVDFTAAFVHADIDRPPNWDDMTPLEQERWGVYVEMPRGFAKPGHVLKLKKSLYGLRQSPRNYFHHLKANLERAGFKSAVDVDPCLFISDKVICLTYVDDCILVGKRHEDINDVIRKLREYGMELEEEDDVAGFLGVHIEKTKDYVKLTQKGLTQRIIDALQVNDLPPVKTPCNEVLGKDIDGDPPNCAFNYASVVGMIWYLYGHSRPDLGMAISQVARFSFAPKRSHELALIRIGQYLKGTLDEGLIMKPMDTGSFKMDVYVDSDFLGLYGKELRTDPDNVKSRTGYVILLNDCPMIWSSFLQEGICTSTMMAEYYALSSSLREVLPLRDVIRVVGTSLGMDENCLTTFRTTVWEDNIGALTLANLDPGQTTPRSKFYDSKMHWFRSHLKPLKIVVERIDTAEQIGDLFTKPVVRETFEYLRKLLMGW